MSTRLRRRALRDHMNLSTLLSTARAMELSDQQASEIEKAETSETVKPIRSPKQSGTDQRNRISERRPATQHQYIRRNQTCRNCGGEFPHKGQCPAKGKSCSFCHKYNHFARVCRLKRSKTDMKSKLNSVNIDDHRSSNSTDDKYSFGVDMKNKGETLHTLKLKRPKTTVLIEGISVEMLDHTLRGGGEGAVPPSQNLTFIYSKI